MYGGVATMSRLLKIIGLFCRISSLLEGSFAKVTYNFKEPTYRSHLISTYRALSRQPLLITKSRKSFQNSFFDKK